MNEYPLTELMHAIDRECKSSEPKVKSARIYTKGDDTSVNSSRTAFFSPKSYPLTALSAFPEQSVITIEERLEKDGKEVQGYSIRYLTLSDIDRIEIFQED